MAIKAERIELGEHTRAADAIAIVFAACLKHLTSNEAAVLNDADPERVHEMRIALRSMRAALSDFNKFLPVHQVTWLKNDTKSS